MLHLMSVHSSASFIDVGAADAKVVELRSVFDGEVKCLQVALGLFDLSYLLMSLLTMYVFEYHTFSYLRCIK